MPNVELELVVMMQVCVDLVIIRVITMEFVDLQATMAGDWIVKLSLPNVPNLVNLRSVPLGANALIPPYATMETTMLDFVVMRMTLIAKRNQHFARTPENLGSVLKAKNVCPIVYVIRQHCHL